MTIAFVTTLNPEASTVAGRILPLAKELAAHASVSVYCLGGQDTANNNAIVKIVSVGKEPFLRTGNGKIRLQGISLALRLLQNCWLTLLQLLHDRPDTVIIVKPLPQNTLAVALARLFYRPKKIILDCDDFELEANVLTSIWQRAAIHVSERLALHVSAASVAATPFLADHITRLGGDDMPVTLLPTGIGKSGIAAQGQGIKLVYAGSISLSSGHRVDLLPGIMHHLSSNYPDVELHICGDGDDVGHIKTIAQEKNVASRIIWHGRFTQPSLSSILSSDTILLDPVDASIVARAKSSYRCMLALNAGLPVITSNIGIRSRLIPQSLQSRLFAETGSATSYAAAIAGILRSPFSTQEKELLKNNLQPYTWETIGSHYWHIINP